MAKVTGPLYSIEASGTYADSFIFSKWEGLNIVKQYIRYRGTSTEKQNVIRDYFSEAITMYKKLNAVDKKAWNIRAVGTPMNGYNFFIKKAMKALTSMRAFTMLNNMNIVDVSCNSAQLSFNSTEGGEALLLYGKSPGAFTHSTLIQLEKGEQDLLLDELNPGQNYYFRILQAPIYLETPKGVIAEVLGEEGSSEYGYQVTALSKTGETLPSKEILIQTGPKLLNQKNFIGLSWNQVPGASEYAVYRTTATGPVHSTGCIGIVNETSFIDTGLEAEKELPTENTAADRQGETGDYYLKTLT